MSHRIWWIPHSLLISFWKVDVEIQAVDLLFLEDQQGILSVPRCWGVDVLSSGFAPILNVIAIRDLVEEILL